MKPTPEIEKTARELLSKGYQLQKQGQIDRAISLYRQAIECYPTAQAYTYLGWALSIKGYPEKAIAECLKAIELDPDYGNPYNDIGAYLIQQRRYKEAVGWLEKALKAPNYENYCYPYMNMARIFELIGDWNRSVEYYEKALAEAPGYKPAVSALEKLKGRYN